jgi:hypothetical protein
MSSSGVTAAAKRASRVATHGHRKRCHTRAERDDDARRAVHLVPLHRDEHAEAGEHEHAAEVRKQAREHRGAG